MSELKLNITWYELLGENDKEFSNEERRDRWENWKELARKKGEDDIVDYWSDASGCRDCIHKDGDWCKLMELPVTINPYLTMKHGLLGMACQGAGYEPAGQKELELNQQ